METIFDAKSILYVQVFEKTRSLYYSWRESYTEWLLCKKFHYPAGFYECGHRYSAEELVSMGHLVEGNICYNRPHVKIRLKHTDRHFTKSFDTYQEAKQYAQKAADLGIKVQFTV